MTSHRVPWFVFAGGGTGGHLYPGIAVACALRELSPGCRVTFFTTDRPIDQEILDPLKVEFIPQPVRPFNPRPWTWAGFLAAYSRSVKLAVQHFGEQPPTAVLGLGGFASAPPLAAALRVGSPTALFNPDAIPGRANRRMIRRVQSVFVQWDATLTEANRPQNMVVTGCPVRPEFLRVTREEGCTACKLDPTRPVLLITGASQGAMTINEAFVDLIGFLNSMPEWQVIHVTGSTGHQMVRKAYAERLPGAKVLEFTPRLGWAMAAADIIVSRAGASTLAEITALGRAAILMPYPYDRARHQMANARVLADAQCALIVEDQRNAAANAAALKPALRDLMTSPERRRRMCRAAKGIGRADAAESIAAAMLRLSGASDPSDDAIGASR